MWGHVAIGMYVSASVSVHTGGSPPNGVIQYYKHKCQGAFIQLSIQTSIQGNVNQGTHTHTHTNAHTIDLIH